MEDYDNKDDDADFEENSDSWATISHKFYLPDGMLFEDFVSVDSDIPVRSVPSDEDIVQEIQAASAMAVMMVTMMTTIMRILIMECRFLQLTKPNRVPL